MIVKIGERKPLILHKKIAAHIRLHPHSDNVAVVAYYVVAKRLQKIYAQKHRRPDDDSARRVIVNILVYYVLCYRGIEKSADGNDNRRDHINGEKTEMWLVIAYKSF